MPLTIPTLDDRKYQDLRAEALARIPVHTREWTNFNESDPGVTLIELFAFLTENLLYRSNQIPERNRRKFLQLLDIPLQPASSARGLVTFENERGPLQTITLNAGLEVRAGQIPFRAEQGLDVLPIEARAYFKRELTSPPESLKDYYRQLYASFRGQPPDKDLRLYETVPFPQRDKSPVDLGQGTVDSSLWIALLVRTGDKPAENTEVERAKLKDKVRQQIGGKTLSLGVVPSLTEDTRRLTPGGRANPANTPSLQYEIVVSGSLPADRQPRYRPLDASSPSDVLARPGVVQIPLPASEELKLWDNLDPLEAGVGDFPPALEDTNLNERIITWLRIRPFTTERTQVSVRVKLFWVGINATCVMQKAHVANELLPTGTGAPDQVAVLSKIPVVPWSVKLTVTADGKSRPWQEIDDLLSANPEVPVPDHRQPPGTWPVKRPTKEPVVEVFKVNPESGEIRFGDGTHGKRLPLDAVVRADYDYGVGRDGNVNEDAINSSPALPAGIKVTNPVPTWGGAEAETVSEGEKQIARYLQHRDRLVNAVDFETITHRTPGVDIGRVDVIPTFNPELGGNEPGDAPGAVTLMVIPKYDPIHPDAPRPNQIFLNTICDYIDSRRLVTTEVFLRGPIYKQIWISVGLSAEAGRSIAEVREAVKRDLLQSLSPLPTTPDGFLDNHAALPTTPQHAGLRRGWPLRKPVVALELVAVAIRVPGVLLVNSVLLAEGTEDPTAQVEMRGLQLPQVAGIAVTVGEPLALDQLRGRATTPTGQGAGQAGQGPGGQPSQLVPVPVIPEEC